ncbi:MAG: hypothetical protein WBL63_03570, partial [Candidatus Acidiferrum sp.]
SVYRLPIIHADSPASKGGRCSTSPGLCWGAAIFFLSLLFAACSSEAPKPVAQKPPEPAIPEDLQDAAKALLGGDAQVLLYGDLAKTGTQQLLAANVVPNTPKSIVAGTVVTRAVVAENVDGKWSELVRADEYLKNTKGYLGLTPLQPVTGWKLQFENSTAQGMSLYFTPVKAGASEKTLPIAVKWNPAAKRYQSMNPSYEHFLGEAATLESPRSILR